LYWPATSRMAILVNRLKQRRESGCGDDTAAIGSLEWGGD
jgi:hypothetical protein